MAERLAEVEARRASIVELGSVTDAMRSLAAARFQQAAAMLPGTRTYAEVIGGALAQAVALAEDGPRRWPAQGCGHAALVLFAPEHGFVGAFAERLAKEARTAPPGTELWVVGGRGAALLEEAGRAPAWSLPMATHADAVIATARRVAEALYGAAAADRLGRVELLYGRAVAGAGPELVRAALLPLDFARFRPARFRPERRAVPPLTNLPPAQLVARLVDEYIYALLAHAALESFAAENAARLSVMMAARHNIESSLETLTGILRRLRQEQITTELIELATGAEALAGGPNSGEPRR